MVLHKLPVLEQRVRLADELFQAHIDQANVAQASEELVGDFVLITELHSELFQENFPRLSSLHSILLGLHGSGFVPLEYVTNLSLYLDNYILVEFDNLRYRNQLLALEAVYDHLHDYHSTRAFNIELSLLTLMAIRNEVLLRAQGNQTTPLADLNLDLA